MTGGSEQCGLDCTGVRNACDDLTASVNMTCLVTDLGGMLSICMDASQVVLNSVDCTGVRNACEDLTASEYDASSMVPRWTSLPRVLEPRPLLILVDFVGEREQFSLNSMSLRFSDGLAEVYLWCVLNRTKP